MNGRIVALMFLLAACGSSEFTDEFASAGAGGTAGDDGDGGSGGTTEVECDTSMLEHGSLEPCTGSEDCQWIDEEGNHRGTFCIAPPGSTWEDTDIIGQCGRAAIWCIDGGCLIFIEDGQPDGMLC